MRDELDAAPPKSDRPPPARPDIWRPDGTTRPEAPNPWGRRPGTSFSDAPPGQWPPGEGRCSRRDARRSRWPGARGSTGPAARRGSLPPPSPGNRPASARRSCRRRWILRRRRRAPASVSRLGQLARVRGCIIDRANSLWAESGPSPQILCARRAHMVTTSVKAAWPALPGAGITRRLRAACAWFRIGQCASASLRSLSLLLAPALLPVMAAVQGPPRPAPMPPPSDVAAPPKDAETLPSGLASKVLQAGTGSAKPGPTDMVTVHYTGWTTDGKMFDSSLARNAPNTFPLDRVIKGWGEGVQLMTVGEKRRLWIPGGAGLQGPGRAPRRHARVRHRAAGVHAASHRASARRRGGARRRQAHTLGAGLQGDHAGHRRRASAPNRAASPCTIPGGRPTASCSTAR